MSASLEGIAIVGLAGRFPKAHSVDEFWRNLCAGQEGITFFTDEELKAAGVSAQNTTSSHVKARALLDNADHFDAAFFGMSPKEAEITDPQHRVFLECSWEALESAGYDPEKYDGAIGVFAGMSMNTYLAENLRGHPEVMGSFNQHQIVLANDKDYLPTRVSYKLNLRGPSLNIQTACSTSLVAVCVACQNLLNYHCDMALAGAVSVSFPQKQPYLYQEGGIASPDGHCRTFDVNAAGTVPGEGCGIVVLKRLEDAVRDRDHIYGVIKGFAMNNDGAFKAGFTAPSVEGQAEAIVMAQGMAGFDPDSISYVEAHGTATPLGDPLELEGLTTAFRSGTEKKGFCAIGSVKTNIGHLDTAAGVAGLIKTSLALAHKQIPPSLNFTAPNPRIDFANSPFYVNAKLSEWKVNGHPRRAGVSSFGMGGTNAHVVLEEALQIAESGPSRPAQLLLLSAKSPAALQAATGDLAQFLERQNETSLPDIAYTLQVGRRHFAQRRVLVCRDAEEAATVLASNDPRRLITFVPERENPPVIFMFPGQGAQYVNMGLELYRNEPEFRKELDLCCDLLKPHLGTDLRSILYPEGGKDDEAQTQLTQTRFTQPALFAVEYALAKLWMSWGVQPEGMIGHSIGEYVAACLSGVFSLEDALKIVAARGRLIQEMPPGAMLAVRLPENELRSLLNNQVSIAAVNSPSLTVLSGPTEAIEEIQRQLAERQIACTALHTSHAFHSEMMDPVVKPLTQLIASVQRQAPRIPFVSNVTGTWITKEQATDPAYWATHARQTVRFAQGAGELLKSAERVFLEVGPGQTLANLTKQNPARTSKTQVLFSLRKANEKASDVETVLTALGQLWLSGVNIDWNGFYAGEKRRRMPLPTYPFERKRFWIEPVNRTAVPQVAAAQNGHAKPERVEPAAPTSPSAPSVGAGTRQEKLVEDLRGFLAELSGVDLSSASPSATFAEIGFESLFLTQASMAIEKKMGVRITFRQLLEEANSLEGLARSIDIKLPQDKAASSPPQATTRSEPSAKGSALVTPKTSSDPERRLRINLQTEMARLQLHEENIRKVSPVVKIESYPGLEQNLNRLCSAYICDYLKSCNITLDTGRRYRLAELKEAAGLWRGLEKFFVYMLQVLAEDGIIRMEGEQIECLAAASQLPDSVELYNQIGGQHPAFEGLLQMLKHCAEHYREALSGEILGSRVLLPEGRHNFLKERLQSYVDVHKAVRVYEQTAKELTLNLAKERPLRVLEVGGGGGDLTWQLVPHLKGLGAEYHFTDIAKMFVQEAEREATRRGLDFMRFSEFDISKDPVRQGYAEKSFDLILGLNVVHAVTHIGETLGQLKRLLVPGGLAALVELTRYYRWDNMIIGLAEGWWLHNDPFRKNSPLTDIDGWTRAFRSQGFDSVCALPAEAARAETDAALIVAQTPLDASTGSDKVTGENPAAHRSRESLALVH